MYNVFIAVVTGILWIIGQIFIFTGKLHIGMGIIVFAFCLGAFLFFKMWKIHLPYSGSGSTALIAGKISGLFAAAAVILAVLAVIIVKSMPYPAFMLFILSGLLLFFAKPADEKLFDFFEIPDNAPLLEKWEPWFMLLLVAVSSFVRLYKIGDFPEAGYGNEGLLMGNLAMLSTKGAAYAAQIGGGTDWPTFTHYIAIIFGKIFGWNIGVFRSTSAVFGVISIVALYFMTRRITSPVTAAISSVMYSVFMLHLTGSRSFVSVYTLLFTPHIICLGILMAASKKPAWYLYLAAGLACGYSLQGYIPGRGVFLLFLIWFIFMFITKNILFHKISNFIFWAAGLLLVASPVILFAIKYPEQYWNYVQSVSAAGKGGIDVYARIFMNQIPSFAGMFYTKSAWETLWHVPYEPIIDFATRVLFAPGLFLCLFAFWKPVPSALLILFLGGMVPGMVGAGSSINPNAPRTEIVFPIIFILFGYAFERIKRVYYSIDKKIAGRLVVIAGIIVSLWSFQNGIHEYIKLSGSPGLLVNHDHHLYLMGKEIKKHKDAAVSASISFFMQDAAGVFIPEGKTVMLKSHVDDFLVMNPASDNLILLDPFYTNTVELFKKVFPNADITRYEVPQAERKDVYYDEKKFERHISAKLHIDPYVPFVYMSSIYVAKKDIKDFQTTLYIRDAQNNYSRVQVFGGSDFGEKYGGKAVTLKGAIIIKEEDFEANKEKPVKLSLSWKSLRINIDGKSIRPGEPVILDSGIHFFEISGIVPNGAKGDLPLTAEQSGRDLISDGRVVAIEGAFGVKTFHHPELKSWNNPYKYSHSLIAPNFRMYDGYFMHLPFSITEKAMLDVPVSGEYEFRANENSGFSISVNDKTVYENFDNLNKPKTGKIMLTKGKRVKFILKMDVRNSPYTTRALTVYVKGPGMEDFIMAPIFWFTPME